jgi:hypothetical protein
MRGNRRAYGLVAGGIIAMLCIGDVISRSFEFGQWFLSAPLIVIAFWGASAYLDVIKENHRRKKILLKHGIDERQEFV